MADDNKMIQPIQAFLLSGMPVSDMSVSDSSECIKFLTIAY